MQEGMRPPLHPPHAAASVVAVALASAAVAFVAAAVVAAAVAAADVVQGQGLRVLPGGDVP